MATIHSFDELLEWIVAAKGGLRQLKKQVNSLLEAGADPCDIRFTAEVAMQNIMSGPQFGYPSITWPGQNQVVEQFVIRRVYKTGYQPSDTMKLYAIMPWNVDAEEGHISWSKECSGWGGGGATEVKLFEVDDTIALRNHPVVGDYSVGYVQEEPSFIDNQAIIDSGFDDATKWTTYTTAGGGTGWLVNANIPPPTSLATHTSVSPDVDILIPSAYNSNRVGPAALTVGVTYLCVFTVGAWSAGDLKVAFYKSGYHTRDQELCSLVYAEAHELTTYYGCAYVTTGYVDVCLVSEAGDFVGAIQDFYLFPMPGILVATEETLTEGIITDPGVLVELIGTS